MANPKEFKIPYNWDERRILIHDRVWVIPAHYDQYDSFAFPGWDHPDLFGNDNPVHIEYCSGNGAWIAEKASQNPEINWVAVEKRLDRVRKNWSKIKNLKLDNLIAVYGEAYIFTKHFVPTETIDEVFINFPDPWPKNKHAKHRLMTVTFFEQLWRMMKKGSQMIFVTDYADYSDAVIKEAKKHGKFHFENYTTEYSNYGSSFFEELWKKMGRTIRFHKFTK